jgi:predicted dehydrogenase
VKTCGIGLVGAGFMGEMHARGYKLARSLRPDLGIEPRLVAVADADEARALAFADVWRPERSTTDWRSVVEDPNVDVVDICAPPAMHREVAAAAIAAGKHVYCEKPVGLSAAETAELVEAAEGAGVATLVGFNYRWIPAVALAKQIVDDGRIGSIRQVAMSFESDWAADSSTPWGWRFSAAAASSGAIGDVGSHVFDMARHLAGELTEVCGMTETFITERDHRGARVRVDTDDAFAALGRFEHGAIGTFEGSRVAPGTTVSFRWTLTGSTGSLRWDLGRMNELELYEPAADHLDGFRTIVLGPEHPIHGTFSPVRGLGVGFADSKIAEVQHLLQCLAEDVRPVPSFRDALAAARLVEGAQAGGWVTVPRLSAATEATDA